MIEETDEESPLAPFIHSGWITGVDAVLKSGKEGTTYRCYAAPRKGCAFFAAKVYRSREHRTFRNDATYRDGRGLGYGQHASRERRAFANKTRFGREVQQSAWVTDEYETMTMLHAAGATVPQPFMLAGNAILMEYFGDSEEAAPLLHDAQLAPGEAEPLFRAVLREVELFLRCRRIHADLSPYNILYWQGRVVVIDFPQAIDPETNANARSLLARDMENVCRYFRPYGIEADAEVIAARLWGRYRRAEL